MSRLESLDADLWAQVVVAARLAMGKLPDHAVTQDIERLRGLPTSRLAGGRGRRDLARLLSQGGAVWVGAHAALGDHPHVTDALAETAPVIPHPATDDRAAEVARLDAAVARLRLRLKDTAAQRDELRRQLDGATARAAAAAAQSAELARQLAETTRELKEVGSSSADVERRVSEAVAREQRRAAAERGRLEAELTTVRRDLDRARTDQAASQRAAQRTPTTPESGPSAPRGFTSGRPSRLPRDIARPSLDAAGLLVHAGRTVFVDGWNVSQLHRPHLDQTQQRRWLVDALVAATGRWRASFTVVFDARTSDGPGSRERQGGVIVCYPPADVSADDELVFAVAAADANVPITVVTDDQELRGRLLEHGVDLVSSMEFGWLLAS